MNRLVKIGLIILMFLLLIPLNAKAEDNKTIMKVSEVPPKVFEITAGDLGVNTVKIAITPWKVNEVNNNLYEFSEYIVFLEKAKKLKIGSTIDKNDISFSVSAGDVVEESLSNDKFTKTSVSKKFNEMFGNIDVNDCSSIGFSKLYHYAIKKTYHRIYDIHDDGTPYSMLGQYINDYYLEGYFGYVNGYEVNVSYGALVENNSVSSGQIQEILLKWLKRLPPVSNAGNEANDGGIFGNLFGNLFGGNPITKGAVILLTAITSLVAIGGTLIKLIGNKVSAPLLNNSSGVQKSANYSDSAAVNAISETKDAADRLIKSYQKTLNLFHYKALKTLSEESKGHMKTYEAIKNKGLSVLQGEIEKLKSLTGHQTKGVRGQLQSLVSQEETYNRIAGKIINKTAIKDVRNFVARGKVFKAVGTGINVLGTAIDGLAVYEETAEKGIAAGIVKLGNKVLVNIASENPVAAVIDIATGGKLMKHFEGGLEILENDINNGMEAAANSYYEVKKYENDFTNKDAVLKEIKKVSARNDISIEKKKEISRELIKNSGLSDQWII